MIEPISFKGIDVAALVHALYHSTRALGMGSLHDIPSLSLADVRAQLDDEIIAARAKDEPLRLDYFHGRPLKVRLDLTKEEFFPGLYDRDAGRGAAARVIEQLRNGADR